MNSVPTDEPRKPFTFTTAVVLAGSSWKILHTMNGKVFPEWLQSSSSRRTAMAGRDGAFLLPPLLSHFGCRHRRCDSDRFAWTRPFGFLGGGRERAENEDAERLFTEAAAAPSQQDDRAPFQRHNDGHRRGNTPELLSSCARCMRRNGCGCFSARQRFDIS